MTIVNLGTYPPKQCGIATFSMDLRNSLLKSGNEVKVLAVSDDNYAYNYSSEVVLDIKQNRKQDYVKAAKYINSCSDIKLLIIQHEYGIYGNHDGQFILEFIRFLHKPYVLVTHTVLPHPSKHQKQILNSLCQRAAGVVCMTNKSSDLLVNLYEAPAELVHIIPHGVPEFKKQPAEQLKEKYMLKGKDIISTFGLIGPGKGLEIGIKAMADVSKNYKDSVFLILGQTHPMLKHYEGEKYRQMLEELVQNHNLENHVFFVNKFLSDEELGEYLYMTDIFLSPYPNKDQAVSGTLSFAIGCGRAIVSTSYSYASEVLNEKRGLLSSEANPEELAFLIETILTDPQLKSSLQKKALELGKTWSWPSIGKEYTKLFNQILSDKFSLEEDKYTYAESQI